MAKGQNTKLAKGESNTNVLPCSCKHEFQDQRYGKGQRLHNRCFKSGVRWRCTVCSTER